MSDFRILDTYKAYKVREKRFTTWLRETASKIGSDKTSTPKDPKDKIRISEIPQIVKKIVKSGTEIPENLADTLRDVISQRKEASVFYQGKGESDEGHAHYVTVLEGVLQTFERSRSAESWSKSGKGKANGNSEASSGTTDVSFKNVFDLLPVESVQNGAGEASGNEDDASEAESEKENRKTPKKSRGKNKSGKNKGKGRKPSKTTEKRISTGKPSEVESGLSNDLDDEDDDLYFMIYCFFKDFNTMREYIQERWCDYQDGLLSLTTVSVITNTSFELIQRGERELLAMMPPRHPLRTYKAISDMLFFQVGLAHVDYDEQNAEINDPKKMEEAFTEEADWICLNRFWDLSQWLAKAPPGKVAFDPRGEQVVDYKSGKGKDKMAADKIVLTDIVMEGTILKGMKANNASMGALPGEDEFTTGLIQFHETRRIPIWFVLACQIQCDIRYILEKNAKHCHEELLAAGKRAKKILVEYEEFQKDFENHFGDAVGGFLKTTQGELDCWVLRDFFQSSKQMLYKYNKFTGDIEEYYYLKRNPVLCGLMVFRFALTMNELGINMANGWGAITAAGHLYSAMQHTTPDLPRWHDLDTLLQIHTAPCFFWDALPPSTPSGFVESYEKASSVSKLIAQREDRNSSRGLAKTATPNTYKYKQENANQSGIGVVSKISALYHERFCFKHAIPIRNLPLVEQILNHTASTEITQTLAGVREILIEVDALPKTPFSTTPSAREISSRDLITTQFQAHNTLTGTQLLSVLCTRLQQESYTLNFDYFGFNIRSMRFLKAVYEEFKNEIIAEYGELEEGRGELKLVVYRVFTWLMDQGKAGDVKERLRGVLEGFVEREGSAEIEALRDYMDGNVQGRELVSNGV